MVLQVDRVRMAYHKKYKYHTSDPAKLKDFMKEKKNIPGVHIPMHSVDSYLQEFNTFHREQHQTEENQLKKKEEEREKRRYKSEVKQFGRPISATPLAVLAKPKEHNDYH